jgi:lysozyme
MRSGIPFGTYHYIDVLENGAAQAKHFLAVISGCEGTLLPAVDVEETHGLSPEHIVACVAEFLKTVDATLKGKCALFYTNRSFWNDTMVGRDDFSGHPLWIAQYPKYYRSGMRPAIPHGWKSAAIWQFTQSARVPGISGVADMDQLIGDDISTISR